ncbi:nucleotidyltransferase family protein [Salipiger sp. IMCC34102]|uniref:nucleotidyltransferase family protein n=1 Tax=Salipiger sp. IMCC34102 TaxID=2510647 RepID=UPI00101CB8F3|nr:nucleotidyltransferase family protein [Salipiger sp. IMCC34102]RYH02777.1 nucleotidyltransferase family protein [Salipiger sp. IMCC34102]
MIPILILAAGASSRMRGSDKCLEVVSGQPLLRRIAQDAVAVGETFVALHHHAEARRAVLAGLPVTPIAVPSGAEGLSGSLRDAVAALPACDAFLVVLADLPRIAAPEMQAVIAARSAHPDALIWRGATASNAPGHPTLFDAALRPAFATLHGDTGAAPLIARHADRTVLIPFADDRARLDLDTPEDWAAFNAE